MKFHKLAVFIPLAILSVSVKSHAAAASVQSETYAAIKSDSIDKQLGLQAFQPRLQAENISINQARQTFFNHPPQLIRTTASQTGVYTGSTYEFTLTVPQDAGQPLKAVTITQAENSETIKFALNDSKAFFGKRLTASSEIRLAQILHHSQ
ncbi:DUF2808 domain-containing protein [Phormidesmis sp. 146-33]